MSTDKRTSVYLGIDPISGREISRTVRYKSDRELAAKKKALYLEFGSGNIALKDIGFSDFARAWLQSSHAESKTNANTYRMYVGAVDRLIERFGNQRLSRIRQFNLEEYLGGRPPHSARIELIVLKNMFRKARKNRYIADDPAEDIKPMKLPKSKKRDLEPFEREAIKNANLSDMQRAFVLLALRCGLARGEIAALTADDVSDSRVRVRRSAVIGNKEMILNIGAKTKSRVRTVPIPDDAKDAIINYAATKESGELLFGTFNRTRYWRFWNQVKSRINDAAGGKSHYDNDKKYRIIDDLKLWKPFTAHILRHAYCCDLYRAGYRPGEVMRLMGHSSVRMSIEVYEHISAGSITADKMNKRKKLVAKRSVTTCDKH